MAHAYTPGLKVTERDLVSKRRVLPLKGEVMVKEGDKVDPDRVVARTHLPGEVIPINVANILGLPPEDVPEGMRKQEGDKVEKGEVIASSKSFFGLFKSQVKAPERGTVENISNVTGQVLLRGEPLPVEVKAYLDGEVVEIYPQEGVLVQSWATFIQGIFGIGGETHGELVILSDHPSGVLTEKEIDESCRGKILVGGSLVTYQGLKKAIEVGAKGVVAGGFNDKDLREFLGYDLGVAITGSEDLGITLVVTEGFGGINMAEKTFELLKSKEGKLTCINGATQIRAGVIRPEVVIPIKDGRGAEAKSEDTEGMGLKVGSLVRVIREPYFGKLGKVSALPPLLQKLETESKARVLEVEFEDRTKAIIPRANVETIEE